MTMILGDATRGRSYFESMYRDLPPLGALNETFMSMYERECPWIRDRKSPDLGSLLACAAALLE